MATKVTAEASEESVSTNSDASDAGGSIDSDSLVDSDPGDSQRPRDSDAADSVIADHAASAPTPRARWRLALAFAVVAIVAAAGGYAVGRFGSGDLVERANAEVTAGIAAEDASQAVAHFQKALEHHPMHYGATYQLARALDRAGRRNEARQAWERVLVMARSYDDKPILEQARARLGPADASDPMAAGLVALYEQGDASTAVSLFRQQLVKQPTHYGATYQLATALERASDPGTAYEVWARMLGMAESTGDAQTATHARMRLAALRATAGASPPDPEGATMQLGLEALYNQKDPVVAAKHFRSVLDRNPEHYGATYQLAMALEQSGATAEARPLWTRALAMADAIGDLRTAAEARQRLESAE